MNFEYDLARPLASALKATAPYVGIPLPGHAPLIFNRAKLKSALSGVKPVSVAVVIHDNGERSLTVEGVAGPRCRTFMRMRSLRRDVFSNWRSEPARAMKKWNPIKAKAKRSTGAKYEKAIAKLQRQLTKLGGRPHLANPCMPYSEEPEIQRQNFLLWRQQKTLRRQIGALAVQALDGKLTDRKFYAALAKLTTVKRFSDFTAKQLERMGITVPWGRNGFFIYAKPKNLWKLLPDLAGDSFYRRTRPTLCWGNWQEWQQWEVERWGAKRYAPVLEWQRQRQEILSQIEGIRALIESGN